MLAGIVDRQHDDPGARAELADLASGLQAIHARHRNIHYDHIRTILARLLHRIQPVDSGADDIDIALGAEQVIQGIPDDAVVVDKQDPDQFPLPEAAACCISERTGM